MEAAQAPAGGIEARWPEMAGAAVEFGRLGLSRMREAGKKIAALREDKATGKSGRNLDQR
jgi:hypothetical protein